MQEPGHPDPLLDLDDRQAIDTGSAGTLVFRDPGERHGQRRRVVHEVEQVIEPTARIGRRPMVQLGLHPSTRARSLGSSLFSEVSSGMAVPPCMFSAAALPHVTGFPGLGVLRRLRPARSVRLSVRLSAFLIRKLRSVEL
jgi:hypothetical protein